MTPPPSSEVPLTSTKWEGRLASLVKRPLLLLTLILLVNAVVRPYRGLVLDSCLYAALVSHQANGAYADDLFIKYGSQDAYSLFSEIAAPMVRTIGLEGTFFVLFLAANALFFWALQRLILRMVKSPAFAVLSLLFIATTPIWFGGLRVFHSNECLFTPRIVANAFVLFGIERILARRMGIALGLMLLALPIHPLMAFPGLLLWGCVAVLERFSQRTAMAIFASVGLAAAAVLLIKPVGFAVFGEFDSDWRDAVKCGNFYAFASEWEVADWMRILGGFVCVATAAAFSDDRRLRTLYLGVLLVAVAGVVGTWIATYAPYALLLQGQPYRALWPLQILAVPAGAQLVWMSWRAQRLPQQLFALAIVFAFLLQTWELAVVAWACAAAVMIGCRFFFAKQAAEGENPFNGMFTTLAIGTFLLFTLQCSWQATPVVIASLRRIQYFVEPSLAYRIVFLILGPGVVLGLGVLVLLSLTSLLKTRRWAPVLVLLLVVGVQLGFYSMPDISATEDVQFLQRVLPQRADLNIHLPCPTPRFAWFKLHANNFFSVQQAAGSMFNRENALEARRRALLTREIDLAAFTAAGFAAVGSENRSLKQTYVTSDLVGEPTLKDLLNLCQQPELDFVLCRSALGENLHEATNGRWFVYRCDDIRRLFAAELAAASH
ncbi:MAG: hypothetical protein AAGF97_05145 [Planctomycetota bacterium]